MSRAAPVILALDCSAAACSAALWRDGAITAHRFEAMSRGQAEALLPMVESAMHAAGAGYGDLDLVAGTVGPGSFTGLRIGLAAVRGIALAAGIPALGIGCFEAVAAALSAPDQARPLAVAIDDRRGGVYWQGFAAGGEALGGPRVLSASLAAEAIAAEIAAIAPESHPLLVAGDGVGVLRARADLAPALAGRVELGPERPPDAAAVARLAAARAAAVLSGAVPALPPRPVYLRAPDAKLPDPPNAAPGAAGPGSAGRGRASHGRA